MLRNYVAVGVHHIDSRAHTAQRFRNHLACLGRARQQNTGTSHIECAERLRNPLGDRLGRLRQSTGEHSMRATRYGGTLPVIVHIPCDTAALARSPALPKSIFDPGEEVFGDARACIKIDCAEFQHSHEIAKLIGSPPGYLGHRETHPLLTQEALNQWHTEKLKLSLLLFDEIEKASDALWQLLLGILDKATLTLGDNRRVDLSHCIICMTSNLGACEMNDLMNGGIGFGQLHRQKNDSRLDDKPLMTPFNS